jgi:hypothetical protein
MHKFKIYEVIKISDMQKPIESGSGENDDSKICYYCKMEKLFHVLETTHLTQHRAQKDKT